MTSERITPLKLMFILIAIAVFTAYVVVLYLTHSESPGGSPQQGASGCPKDAKVCPDGSIVTRSGPSCQFDTCQVAENISEGALNVTLENLPDCDTKGYFSPKQKIHVFGNGFLSETTIKVGMMAENGRFAADFSDTTSGAAGEINAVLTIPENTPTGNDNAWFVVRGKGPDNRDVVLKGIMRIAPQASLDTDANGMPDVCEKSTS